MASRGGFSRGGRGIRDGGGFHRRDSDDRSLRSGDEPIGDGDRGGFADQGRDSTRGSGGFRRDEGDGGGDFNTRGPREGDRGGFSRTPAPSRVENGFSRASRDDGRARDIDPPSRGGFDRREEGGFGAARRNEGGRGGFDRPALSNVTGSRGGFDRARDDDRGGAGGLRSQHHDNTGYGASRGGFGGRDRDEGGFGGSRGGGRREDERGFGSGARSGGYDEDPREGFDRGASRGGFSAGRDRDVGGGFRAGNDRFGDDRQGGGGGFRRGRDENGFSASSFRGGADRGSDRERGPHWADESVPEEDMVTRAPRGWAPNERNVGELFEEDENNTLEEQANDREVTVTGTMNDQARIDSWDKSPFSEKMIHMLEKQCHYPKPRNIQAATMPQILSGQDVMGQAETGSGKTAAFVLPIVHRITEEKAISGGSRGGRPYAIIIAPTRELCHQLFEQCKKFASCCKVSVAKAYGQYDVNKNIMEIANGCDIICACTGRLRHLMQNGEIKPDNVKFLVLDECDRILRNNFKKDVDEICETKGFPTKEDRQTLMFSATVDDDVQMMAAELLRPNHAFISLKGQAGANAKVVQKFVELSGVADKNNYLFTLLKDELKRYGKVRKTLIFVRAKRRTDIVAMVLSKEGIPALSINGDRPQNLREKAMKEFRQGVVNVLVGTDVCERGLDIRDLEHVIQYDIATTRDTYVHRIGRTGRVKRGDATAFINPDEREEADFIPELVKIVDDVQQEVPEWMRNAANNTSPNLAERFGEQRLAAGRERNYSGSGRFVSQTRDNAASSGEGGFGSNNSASKGFANQNKFEQANTGPSAFARQGSDEW